MPPWQARREITIEDYSKRLAAATTASTVKPKCSNSGFAGAEWPKRSMPMHVAARADVAPPAARRAGFDDEPRAAAAATRDRDSRRAARSNACVHGIDTTRTATPDFSSSLRRADGELHLGARGDQRDRGRGGAASTTM